MSYKFIRFSGLLTKIFDNKSLAYFFNLNITYYDIEESSGYE